MPNISDSFRTLAIALLFLIGLFGWLLPMTLLLAPFGKHTEAMRHRLMWRACRFAARHLPETKLEVKGEKEAEWQRPSVLVSNHQSSLDLLCLLMLSPRLVVVTNQRQWRNALYGAVIRRLNFLPIDMGFDAMQQQVGRLAKEGYSVVIFPEGTRSRNGRLGRFHQGAFALAAHLKLPLVPVVLHGTDRIFPKGSHTFRRGKIEVEIHPAWPAPDNNEAAIRETRHKMRALFMERLGQGGGGMVKSVIPTPT